MRKGLMTAMDALEASVAEIDDVKKSMNPQVVQFYNDFKGEIGSWNRLMNPKEGDSFYFYSLDRNYEIPYEEWNISIYKVEVKDGFFYSHVNGEECILIPRQESWTSWSGNYREHRYCQVITLKGDILGCIWFTANFGGPNDMEFEEPYSYMDVVYQLFGKEIDNWMECKKFRYEVYISNTGKTYDVNIIPTRVKLNIPEVILRYIESAVFNVFYKHFCGVRFYIHGGVSPKELIESDKQGIIHEFVNSLRSREKSKTSDSRKFHREKLNAIKALRRNSYMDEEDLIKFGLISPFHHSHGNFNKIFLRKVSQKEFIVDSMPPTRYTQKELVKVFFSERLSKSLWKEFQSLEEAMEYIHKNA